MDQIKLIFVPPSNIRDLGDSSTDVNMLVDHKDLEAQAENAVVNSGLATALGNFESNILKKSLFAIDTFWDGRDNTMVKHFWLNDSADYISAWNEFTETYSAELAVFESLGWKFADPVVVKNSEIDVAQLNHTQTVAHEPSQFVSLLPQSLLESYPSLEQYYTTVILAEKEEFLRIEQINNARIIAEANAAEAAELARQAAEQAEEQAAVRAAEQAAIDAAVRAAEERRNIEQAAIQAEKERKSQEELETNFKLMMQNRQQAEEELVRLKAEYDAKIESLTATLLPKLKNNPLCVVEVLESEIMPFETTQVAISEAIASSDEACELVIKSPQHLWNTNFIIMRAIILKVTYNKNLAQMIGNVFPPDHLLITMLNKVGR